MNNTPFRWFYFVPSTVLEWWLTLWLFDCHFHFLPLDFNNTISNTAPVAVADYLSKIDQIRCDQIVCVDRPSCHASCCSHCISQAHCLKRVAECQRLRVPLRLKEATQFCFWSFPLLTNLRRRSSSITSESCHFCLLYIWVFIPWNPSVVRWLKSYC